MQDLEQLGRHSHRVLLSYDGTRYRGWQLQLGGAAHVPTVQHAVEHALSVVLREPRTKLGVSAAGRTDAGVHAAGQVRLFRALEEGGGLAPGRLCHPKVHHWLPLALQVVQFFTDTEPDASKLHRRINGLLPPDVRAMAVRRTAPDFHVTISATGKASAWCGALVALFRSPPCAPRTPRLTHHSVGGGAVCACADVPLLD